eukprot:5019265-Pyramimonas_sp.AAC.3
MSIDSTVAEFDIREIKSEHFRYCCLQVVQDEDLAVSIATEGNIENVEVAPVLETAPLREVAMRAKQRS